MIKVYKYGLLPPTGGAEKVREQILLAHRYRNDLTQIERGRRAAIRAAMSEHGNVAVLEQTAAERDADVVRCLSELSTTKSQARSPKVPQHLRDALAVARAAKSEAVRELREHRAKVREDEALQARIADANAKALELSKSVRAYGGVFWGTYLLVEDAAKRASDDTPLYDGAEPLDPRFSRFDGTGEVGVQIQGGMTAAQLFGCADTRLHVAPVDERAWHSPLRGERRLASRTTVKLRVGSEGRAPIWAEWPMTMHRPLPEGSIVKGAVVHLRRVGPREEWTLTITVDIPDGVGERCGDGAVAIDVGWRIFGEEVRVATYRSTHGEVGELRLPARILSGFEKAESLRSIRDTAFNAARAALGAWLATDATRPEWLSVATKTLGQWRGVGRLAALAKRWRDHRFPGDEEVYAALETWRYHDHHLWGWETGQTTRTLRSRKEIYRVFAAGLARKYGTLVLERFDLREVATKKAPDLQEKSENKTARYDRQRAAISELRGALEQAFKARLGGEVCLVDGAYTTRTCSDCGHIAKFDSAKMVHHACPSCGVVWDQDENAAANILAIYERERESDKKKTGGARAQEKRESRWARAKREKAERMAAKGGARESPSNTAES